MSTSVPAIRPLTGLRIVAAIWVLLYHFYEPTAALLPAAAGSVWQDLIKSGYLGVELFFVLSGFIISHNYARRFEVFNLGAYRVFLRARFARLYPVHLVTLFVALVLVIGAGLVGQELNSADDHSPVSFVMNLILLQVIPAVGSWNGTSWSISAEAAAYLAFPVLALVVMRIRSLKSMLACVLLGCAVTWLGIWAVTFDGTYTRLSLTVSMLRIAGEFTAGCFLWAFWHEGNRRSLTRPAYVGDVLAVAGVLGLCTVILFTPGQPVADFTCLPFVCMIVIGCAQARGLVSKVLSLRWMEYGGRISYSLYMWHFLVLMIVGKAMPWGTFTSAALPLRIAVLFAYLGLSVVGAIALYHLVEEPGRRLIRRTPRRSALYRLGHTGTEAVSTVALKN